MTAAPIVIRPIEPADLDSYIEAYAEVSAEGLWIGGELPLSDRKLATLHRGAVERPDSQLTLVAIDGDRVVGWVVVVLEPFMRTEIGMALRGAYRGHGLGRRLLEGAVEWSKAQGAHKVDLDVWPHNAAAIALYERAGFVKEGHRRRHWRRESGELWDAVEMSLVLDETSPGSPY